ncbi:MAG: gamma-glutamyltranspeptidase, partial [Limisphaerales bacterium]
PDELRIEKRMDASIIEGLKKLGHKPRSSSTLGVSQIISYDPNTGFSGVADPRAPGSAAGY